MPTPKAHKDCPDLQQYQRMASSLLSDADKEALLRHLEGCDPCANKLSRLPDQDTLVKLLRQAGTVSERGSRETIAVLVARLSKLRPRSAPSMSNLFSCPVCDQRMKIAEELSGKQVKCPYCKQIIRVPAAATPPPVSTVDFRPPAKTSGSGKLEATVDLHPTRETHKQFLEFLLRRRHRTSWADWGRTAS